MMDGYGSAPDKGLVRVLNCLVSNRPCPGRNGDYYTVSAELVMFPGYPAEDGVIKLPAVKGRPIGVRSALVEMLWMLSGHSNVKELHKHGVHYWDQWAAEDGSLGPVYGAAWNREWQLESVLQNLIYHPYSRRNLVTAWHDDLVDEMALPPCHFSWQVVCHADNTLDLVVYQRSVDLMVGAPHNWVQYALLQQMLCRLTRRTPGNVRFYYGCAHVYAAHLYAVKKYIAQVSKMPEDLQLKDTTADCSALFDRIDAHGVDAICDCLHKDLIPTVNYSSMPTIEVEVVK